MKLLFTIAFLPVWLVIIIPMLIVVSLITRPNNGVVVFTYSNGTELIQSPTSNKN